MKIIIVISCLAGIALPAGCKDRLIDTLVVVEPTPRNNPSPKSDTSQNVNGASTYDPYNGTVRVSGVYSTREGPKPK